jgi:predicted porin
MKRLLLGTSALVTAGVLVSGPAAAAGLEASLNGYMEQWFGFRSVDNDGSGASQLTDFDHKSDTEVHFQARATLDNGLKVRYHVELEGNTGSDQIDESYITLTGSFGQFLMGSENSAQYKMNFAPKDFGITAVSGDNGNWANEAGILAAGGGHSWADQYRAPWGSAWIEADNSCNDDKRLTYFTPRFSGFQFGVSYTPECTNQDSNTPSVEGKVHSVVNVGANYVGKFDQIGIKIGGGFGYGNKPSGNTGSDPSTYSMGTNISFGGFTFGGYYADTLGAIHRGGDARDPVVNDDNDGLTFRDPAQVTHADNTGYAAGLAYETGPWGVSVVWRHGERDDLALNNNKDEVNVIHLGAQYKLGPGVALKGTIGYTEIEDEGGADQDGFYVVGGIKVSF